MAAPAEISCASCDYYKLAQVDLERARAAGVFVPPGQCWRFPTPVARQPEDRCGEHQTLKRFWADYLAERIVEKLTPPEAPLLVADVPNLGPDAVNWIER